MDPTAITPSLIGGITGLPTHLASAVPIITSMIPIATSRVPEWTVYPHLPTSTFHARPTAIPLPLPHLGDLIPTLSPDFITVSDLMLLVLTIICVGLMVTRMSRTNMVLGLKRWGIALQFMFMVSQLTLLSPMFVNIIRYRNVVEHVSFLARFASVFVLCIGSAVTLALCYRSTTQFVFRYARHSDLCDGAMYSNQVSTDETMPLVRSRTESKYLGMSSVVRVCVMWTLLNASAAVWLLVESSLGVFERFLYLSVAAIILGYPSFIMAVFSAMRQSRVIIRMVLELNPHTYDPKSLLLHGAVCIWVGVRSVNLLQYLTHPHENPGFVDSWTLYLRIAGWFYFWALMPVGWIVLGIRQFWTFRRNRKLQKTSSGAS